MLITQASANLLTRAIFYPNVPYFSLLPAIKQFGFEILKR
jgi:hypothetical protein